MATKEVLVEAFSKKRSVKFVSEGEKLSKLCSTYCSCTQYV